MLQTNIADSCFKEGHVKISRPVVATLSAFVIVALSGIEITRRHLVGNEVGYILWIVLAAGLVLLALEARERLARR